ncbi:integrase catalytic domain-containing protein [Trichonephila clavata]|uniref:Integrase catalytic domain-containing protein n=1 Tax=Trichonephila clavata TaxID=2740835 RepID=A0A8X6LBK3_TRICU|nr:integrase catalytic domain-containing protein [Trichonephila clavata]
MELKQLLQRGGMTLHKWCTNLSPTNAKEFPLDRNSEEIQVKTLVHDLEQYISQQWENFIKTLPDLEKIKVPRCFLKNSAIGVVLHGFADASSKAYGAVVYMQAVSITEESNCQLLCSKSRVAPTKLVTIPRLELCASLLLSKLTSRVISALKMQIESVQLWSASTIALAWINTPPYLLKTFVGIRVSRIQKLSKDFQWKHISSESNPADVISRGLDVRELATNDLWWKGPDLRKITAATPNSLRTSSTVTDQCYTNELKPILKVTLKLNIDSKCIDNFLDRTNNFHKLIRILAFIFRFIKNCKPGVKQTLALTLEEYGLAEIFLIKHFQAGYFSTEIASLKKGSSVPQSSKLRFLNPFIDREGLLRG